MALILSTGLRQSMLTSGDIKSIMDLGFISIYTGSQPADSNDAVTGSLLVTFYSTEPTVGLSFDEPVVGVLSKAAAESWAGTGLATGTAGWFRFFQFDTDVATSKTNGEASSVVNNRFDGACAVSGAELNLSTLSIVLNAIETISAFSITQPAQ